MKSMFWKLAVVSLSGIVLASCGAVPFARLAGGAVDTAVAWKSTTTDARAVEPAPQSRAVTTDTALTAWYDAYYASLGSRVLTATPSKFSFSVPIVILSNPNRYRMFRFTDREADFAAADSLTTSIETDRVLYDTLYLQTKAENGELLVDAREIVPQKPSIVVALPGYDDGALPDVLDAPLPSTGETTYARRYLGSNTFHVTPAHAQPDISGFYPTNPGFPVFIENIIITANTPTLRLIVPDPLHSSSTYTVNANYGTTNTDRPFLLIPWSGLWIRPETQWTELAVTLDLTDIVEVYDATTPHDPTDDVIILANRFWERFGLTATQVPR